MYRHGDLIDPAWAGYSIVRGRLVTPENHTFEPHELSWLSLLVRRARAFSDLLRERDARAAFGAKATEPARVARELAVLHAARLQHGRDASPPVVVAWQGSRVDHPALPPAIVPPLEQLLPSYPLIWINTPHPIGEVYPSIVASRGTMPSPCSNTGRILAGGAP